MSENIAGIAAGVGFVAVGAFIVGLLSVAWVWDLIGHWRWRRYGSPEKVAKRQEVFRKPAPVRPRIYVAGPYTASTPEGELANVRAALDVAEQLWAQGWAPVVPHTQGYLWHQRHPHHYDAWIALALSWLSGCDAIYRMPGQSSGADREVRRAGELWLPLAMTLEESAEILARLTREAA